MYKENRPSRLRCKSEACASDLEPSLLDMISLYFLLYTNNTLPLRLIHNCGFGTATDITMHVILGKHFFKIF